MNQIVWKKNKLVIILHYFIVAVAIAFLFIGTPARFTMRSMITGWELGHMFLFALLGIITLKDITWLKNKTFFFQAMFLIAGTIIVGGVIELFQFGL